MLALAGTVGMDQSVIRKMVAEIGITLIQRQVDHMRVLAGRARIMGHREFGM